MLVWVSHGYTGIPNYLAQASQTTPDHPGQQSGDTPHHHSLPLVWAGVSHQTLSTGVPFMGGPASGLSGHKGGKVCSASLYLAGLKKASVVETE